MFLGGSGDLLWHLYTQTGLVSLSPIELLAPFVERPKLLLPHPPPCQRGRRRATKVGNCIAKGLHQGARWPELSMEQISYQEGLSAYCHRGTEGSDFAGP